MTSRLPHDFIRLKVSLKVVFRQVDSQGIIRTFSDRVVFLYSLFLPLYFFTYCFLLLCFSHPLYFLVLSISP